MSNHIIHKQKVILKIRNLDNAFAYQDAVSKMFSNGLASALEATLNEIDVPNTVIRIDKLNIELGEVDSAKFKDEFKEKFLQQLKENITATSSKKNVTATIIKQSDSVKEAFVYFIKKGILPWYIEVKNMPAFEALLFEKLNEQDWQFIVKWFFENENLHKQSIERLVLQFSNKFKAQILAAIYKNEITADDCEKLLQDIKAVYEAINLKKDTTIKVATNTPDYNLVELFHFVFKNYKFYSAKILIARQLHSYFEKSFVSDVKQLQVLAANIKTEFVSTIIKNISFFYQQHLPFQKIKIEDLLIKDLPSDESALKKYSLNQSGLNEDAASNETNDLKNNTSSENEKVSEKELIKKNKSERKKFNEDEENQLFVDNSGVVLLHPFLLSYFEELQLVNNKQFINEDAQQRAVLLLYYLCTGITEVAEFNLALQKILCGFISEDTMPSYIDLSQKEIDESAKLLDTVISYWPPLKNTSIEGLQNTFLQRKGKLTATETGWQLTVEQKTVDILINKLPWGFSTIKLPWMQHVLNVEWC